MFALVGLTTLVPYLILANHASAVPSPHSIGGDVTILLHNDLYGYASKRQDAAIVLDTRLSFSDSLSACGTLGEELWIPRNNDTSDFLRYLEHDKPTDEVKWRWIGKIADNSTCMVIDPKGNRRHWDCNDRLPALCSQSASLSSPQSADADPKWQTVVKSGNASIVGYRDKLSFRFLGLKYASKPVRFGNSLYQTPSGNVSALAYGPGCIQAGCTEPSCSEDCLLLNIWTPYLPAKSPSVKKKAVMLWIHGGGFTSGYGSDSTFDGGNMASRGDVVVVTINYRLSTLGFLALENSTLLGNYWLSDQIAALDWVQNHIEDFGGDKDRVTIFGQSAGGASVRALLASPRAKGKFSRAIMQSCPGGTGYASTFSQYLSLNEATSLTKAILNETGCVQPDKAARLACLRAQDPSKLVGLRDGQWTGTVARYPVVDGTYLTREHLLLNGSGPALDVAVMAGIMRDDGGPFSSFSKSTNASEALTEQGYDAANILSSNKFPIPQGANSTLDIFNLTARVATDAEFRCLSQSTAFSAASKDVFPVTYSYEIDRSYQISEWSPNPPTCEAPASNSHPLGDPDQPYFRCHSGELYYVFGTVIRQGRQPRDEHDIPFSQYLLDSWTAFGRTKNPTPTLDFLQARGFSNTSAVVQKAAPWKAVEASNPKLRVLDVEPRNEAFREQDQCEVLKFPLDYYTK